MTFNMTNEKSIEVLKSIKNTKLKNPYNVAAVNHAIKALKERPTGKWIDHWSEDLHKLGYRQCSNCKAGCQIYEHGTRKSDLSWIDGQPFTLERICKYCPNCGADMRGNKNVS